MPPYKDTGDFPSKSRPALSPAYPSWFSRLPLLLLSATAVFVAAGCHSTLTHQQHFVAQDPKTGQVSVIRLTVESTADFHDVEFRAGYVPSTAIDEVVRGRFDHIFKTPEAGQNSIEQTQQKAIELALTDLRAAFAQPWDTGRSAVAQAEARVLSTAPLVCAQAASEAARAWLL